MTSPQPISKDEAAAVCRTGRVAQEGWLPGTKGCDSSGLLTTIDDQDSQR